MHGTISSEMRNGSGAALSLADERMDQVRELLFGDHKRLQDMQIAALEARLQELQATFSRRIEELELKLAQLSGETRSAQQSAFAELAQNVGELGERIRAISRS